MSVVQQLPTLVVRQLASAALSTAAAASTTAAAEAAAETQPSCVADNEYNGRIGVRISAIFVILIGSLFGAAFPVFAYRHRGVGVPEWAFFIAKYFGSGVIIATAFIHLLAPANEALGDPCLTGPITEYPWVEGIALMTVFSLFFAELMAMRFNPFSADDFHQHSHSDDHFTETKLSSSAPPHGSHSHARGEDHLGHMRDHTDNDDVEASHRNTILTKSPSNASHKINPNAEKDYNTLTFEDYTAQMTAIFVLEFGVIFHSVFIGLTLAVAGSEFITLYIVLVFHQTFEGLALGSRLAATPWPKSKRWTPYLFALAYGLTTPISIAIGLGVRETYAPGSQTALMINGVFDSISAGILIYTGLVELMAHEFMFSSYMRKTAKMREVLAAFGMMCLGAGLMALLGKWA